VGKEHALFEPGARGIRFNVRVCLVVGAGLSLLCALYAKILALLAVEWYTDGDATHGFFVPIVSGYVMWEQRTRLAGLPVRPSVWGAVLLGFGLMMLLIGSAGSERYLQQASFIVVLAGLILLLLGSGFLRVLAFPIGFLFFMVPLPSMVMDAFAFPLQLLATKTAAVCLFHLGIPVLREGNLIVLADTTLEVAEACSGLRSLQALLGLGTVYAYFFERVMWKRWLLVLLSIPIAISANAFRVSGTGVVAHYWGVEAAEGFYHMFSGWLIFVVAFLLLIGCGSLLSKLAQGTPHAVKGKGLA